MSFIDSYRRDVLRHNQEISKLQRDKGYEAGKRADLQRRIASDSEAASRSSSPSTKQSKLRDIERHQRDIASVERRIADYESKIAREQERMADAQKKLSQEEDREFQKREREQENASRAQETRMRAITGKLQTHDTLHAHTFAELRRLSDLPEKITVLFLAANPLDQNQLRLDEEARAITETIRKSKHRDSVQLISAWAVRPPDVLQELNERKPEIVHFSGHGSDRDEIVFQDDQGQAKLVSKEAIVQLMMACSGNIRLVFFNTCYSHNQAEAVVQHVEAAIGMKTSIGDEPARIFASQFYSAIGFGLSVEKAFQQARALVMMEGVGEEDTPELFVRPGLSHADIIIVRPTDATESPI
jgi:CHAT domain